MSKNAREAGKIQRAVHHDEDDGRGTQITIGRSRDIEDVQVSSRYLAG